MKLRSLALTFGLVGLVGCSRPNKEVSYTGVLGSNIGMPEYGTSFYEFRIRDTTYFLRADNFESSNIDLITDPGDTITVNVDTKKRKGYFRLGGFTAADISNIRRPTN